MEEEGEEDGDEDDENLEDSSDEDEEPKVGKKRTLKDRLKEERQIRKKEKGLEDEPQDVDDFERLLVGKRKEQALLWLRYMAYLLDAGLGIEAAALEKGLDFIPLVRERYHLVCLKSALSQAPVQALLQVLQSPAWQAAVAQLPGYSVADAQSGQVLSMRALLPWWHYRSDKPSAGQSEQERKPQKTSSRSDS